MAMPELICSVIMIADPLINQAMHMALAANVAVEMPKCYLHTAEGV